MTQEEKARRFDEVLAMAKDCITYIPDDAVNQYMLDMFPELKESKDEWIRKMCMRYLDREYQHCSFADDKKNIEKCIAWLEKQGEQKSAVWSDKDENMLKSIIATCELAEQDRDSSPAKHLLEMQTNWLKSLKQRIHVSPAKTCENDTLLDLLHKMPSCITVDGLDYHFVMAKHSYYIAYYKAIGEEGRGNAIFGITAYSPIDLLTAMLEELKEKGLLE